MDKQTIKRIELKWECIRRSTAYKKDFNDQVKMEERADRYSKRWSIENDDMSMRFQWKWFMHTLPDPKYSAAAYRRRYGKHYKAWLIDTMGGLVRSDPITNTPVSLESLEVEKAIYPERFMARWTAYDSPRRKEAPSVDIDKLRAELRGCRVVFDATMSKTDTLINSFARLVRDVKAVLNKAKWKAKMGYRLSDVEKYLKAYDLPRYRRGTSLSGESADDPARKLRRYRHNARCLIEQRGWRLL